MDTKAETEKQAGPKTALLKKGKRHRMTVGSQIPLVTDEEKCVISYLAGDAQHWLTRFNTTCEP